jgi:hypothetical protein
VDDKTRFNTGELSKRFSASEMKDIDTLNAVSNPKTTVLANVMFEAQRQAKGGGGP